MRPRFARSQSWYSRICGTWGAGESGRMVAIMSRRKRCLNEGNPACTETGRGSCGACERSAPAHQHGVHRARFARTGRGPARPKTVDAWLGILHELDAFPIHRRDEPIIAIGGGVLTDVVGFVASSYRRGVPHIKVPTTLMGYVDASVGVKSGINFNHHKNRLGSFEAPLQVLLDRAFLATLPHRHILNGVCEIIKLALINDVALFVQLEQHGADCID